MRISDWSSDVCSSDLPAMPFLAICPRNFSKEPAMDDGTPPNVVHEAEAQRQHPRVRVPGIIHVAQSGGEHRYALHDLSAGGLSFVVTDGARFKLGDTYRARRSFTFPPEIGRASRRDRVCQTVY